MKEILSFLKRLAANNNREWFQANKKEYENVKGKVENLTLRLIAAISEFDPAAAHLSVSDCTYRIYRDTRFSHDKTPYKTHIGIFINPPLGKKSMRLGYYLHIEPGNSLFAAGTIGLPSNVLREVRQSIYDNTDEYLGIIQNVEFRKLYPTVGEDLLKTTPKGFPKDWEHIDLLRPRNFIVGHALDDKIMLSEDIVKTTSHMARVSKPFLDFINYTVDECCGYDTV